ncbi:hypothetical protein NHX12_012089 [Muraenolepis orangiensis]|uniref:Calcium binding protein 39 n=1 Tax=Muraenolepis orangiensis TaxID=630683 RepID=A0A9Q0DL06_9TELE|nr:hypothetical protein NHX12_012089 [Muraenolepis orangiensis]
MAYMEKLDATESKKCEKVAEEVSKNLSSLKEVLCGTGDKEPQTEAVAQLAQELYNTNLLIALIANLQRIDFEGKKDVVHLFSNIEFYCFFGFVELSTFDIASDAFASFKDLLTRHKIMCADFLETNYDRLLGELLLDRHNFTVMTKYISRAENLKLMMNLLRDNSRNIQFEAFHVFKVFVANPNKTQPVLDILLKNQAKLVDFLSHFQTDRSEDEQFCDEKNYLMKQIRDLKRPAAPEEA